MKLFPPVDVHNARKSSGTLPNFRNTVASRKSPVAGSPVRLNATAPVCRLCQPLEAHFAWRGNQKDKGVPNQTKRERMLHDDPASRNLYSTLEDVIQGKRGKVLRRILLNWNFPFAPTNYKHGGMRYHGFSMVNPVLVRRFLDPLDAGTSEGDKLADEIWTWAKENVHLPCAFIDLYEQERVNRRTKAKK
jgi:hypothetical protein